MKHLVKRGKKLKGFAVSGFVILMSLCLRLLFINYTLKLSRNVRHLLASFWQYHNYIAACPATVAAAAAMYIQYKHARVAQARSAASYMH